MSKLTKAKEHLSTQDVKEKIRNTLGFWRVQKWLIVYNALNFPRNSKEIAEHLAVSKSLVHKTISEYNRFGPKSIDSKGKGGRRHSYLTLEEENAFISGFISKSQKGYISTAGEIKEAYEKIIGKKVHKTTIYRDR